MNKLFLMIVISLILTISCDNKNEIKSEQIEKHFDSEDRKELLKIVEYVDSLVVSTTQLKDIEKAYHKYLDSLRQRDDAGKRILWAVDEEIKYDFLFSIDSTVFNKIWFKSTTSRIVKTKDTTLYNPENFISIDLNYKGDFVKLVHDLGTNSEYYKDFYEAIEISGGLSPSIATRFLYNHKDFDFNNSNDRLWVAVFVLSLEESVEKKVKRYLNE